MNRRRINRVDDDIPPLFVKDHTVNSCKKYIVGALFMVVFSHPCARATDVDIHGSRTLQERKVKNGSTSCHKVRSTPHDKGQLQEPHRDKDKERHLDCNNELLGEIEKAEAHPKKTHDQQTDILEKLLLEGSKSEIKSTTREKMR